MSAPRIDSEQLIEDSAANLIIAFRRWCLRNGIKPPTVDQYRRILDEALIVGGISLPGYARLGDVDPLIAFAQWIRDVDPTTTTWNRAKSWAGAALTGTPPMSMGQLFDPSDDPDDSETPDESRSWHGWHGTEPCDCP